MLHLTRNLRNIGVGIRHYLHYLPAATSMLHIRPLHGKAVEGQAADAKRIFQAAIDAVLPTKMVERHLKVYENRLSVNGQDYPLRQNVHIAAFGKAVAGMVCAAEKVLGEHLVEGVASVPLGMRDALKDAGKIDMWPSSGRVQVIEGAANNMPDENSLRAALEIKRLAESVTPEDIFLVLISGGGSALLSAPLPPITLKEKHALTKLLASRGASIQELNTIRSKISLLKGGKLASLANTDQIIALILSDVVGDPLDIIACGPTVPSQATTQKCLDILNKYTTPGEVPDVIKALSESPTVEQPLTKHVNNVIVGSNRMAVNSSELTARDLGYTPVVLSTSICGEARLVGETFAELTRLWCESYRNPASGPTEANRIWNLLQSLDATEETHKTILTLVEQKRPICLIGAGETTVTLKGDGSGGRNQEMVLSWAVAMDTITKDTSEMCEVHVTFLSGGTDGQDGPTDAAGAWWAYPGLDDKSSSYGLDAVGALASNDSYTFFSGFREGIHLIKIGLTGTNVMDIQVLLINPLV